jgi:hypothetical protein
MFPNATEQTAVEVSIFNSNAIFNILKSLQNK